MGWLFRVVIRLFSLFVVATTLLACGSAVVAAVWWRRMKTTEDPASNDPTTASVFSSERFVSRAPALRGGRVITGFAGHDVDLRGATIDPAGAAMEIRVMYGGTQIAVPGGWRVRSKVSSIFGGVQVDVDDSNLAADAPLLELRGLALFGGVRVTTSPTVSWSGPDHDGEARAPAFERGAAGADAPMAVADAPMAVADAPLAG